MATLAGLPLFTTLLIFISSVNGNLIETIKNHFENPIGEVDNARWRFWMNQINPIWIDEGRVSFEKLTDLDYAGTTYYTIRNLSLYECQGWCREEPDCAAASFRWATHLHITCYLSVLRMRDFV